MRLAREITMKGDEKGQKSHLGMWSITVVDGETWRFDSVLLCSAVYVDGDIGITSKTGLQNTDLQIALLSSSLSVLHLMQNS